MVERAIFCINKTDKAAEEKNKQLDAAIEYLVDFFGEKFRKDITTKINSAVYIFSEPKGTEFGRTKYKYEVFWHLIATLFPLSDLQALPRYDEMMNFLCTDPKFIITKDDTSYYKSVLSKLTGKKEEEIDIYNLDSNLKAKFDFIKRETELKMAKFDKKQIKRLGMGGEKLNQYLIDKIGVSLDKTSTYELMTKETLSAIAQCEFFPYTLNGQDATLSVVYYHDNPDDIIFIHELCHIVSRSISHNGLSFDDPYDSNMYTFYFNECLTEFIAQNITSKKSKNDYSIAFSLIEDFFEKNIDTLKELYITNNVGALEKVFGPYIIELKRDLSNFFQICNLQGYSAEQVFSFIKGKNSIQDDSLLSAIDSIKHKTEYIEEYIGEFCK